GGELDLHKDPGVDAISAAGLFYNVLGPAAGGTVRWLADNQVNDNGFIIAGNGTQFDLNNFSDTIRSVQFDDGGLSTGSGNLTITNDLQKLIPGSLAAPPSSSSTVTGNITLGSSGVFFGNSTGKDLIVAAKVTGAGGLSEINSGRVI